jgi:hypothetical protein
MQTIQHSQPTGNGRRTFYSLSIRFVLIISLCIFALLLVLDLFSLSVQELVPITFLLTLVFCFLAFLTRHKKFCLTGRRLHIVLAVWFLFIGFAWNCICFFSIPSSDQNTVYWIAQDFSNNNYAAMSSDGYLSCYPHQLGLIFFYELIIRSINLIRPIIPFLDFMITETPQTYLFILRFINLLAAVLVVEIGSKLTEKLFHNDKTTFIYVLSMVGCIPFLLYIPFIYGEILSLAFIFLGIWFFTKLQESCIYRSFINGLLVILFVSLGTIVRKNTLIVVIAFVIICLYTAFHQKKFHLILFASLLVYFSTFACPNWIQNMYETKASQTLNEGIPSLAWIAMGLQEGGGTSGYGGNNGFNFDTFVASGFNTEESKQISILSIQASVSKFIRHPAYAITFFRHKLADTWTEEDFQVFWSTLNNYKPNAVFNAIYQPGVIHSVILLIMKVFQIVIYISALCSITKAIRQKKSLTIEMLFFPIVIIGGFIFYLFWESGCRYIFPYFLMAIPAAADGLTTLTGFHLKSLKDRLQLHKKTVLDT